MIHLKRLLVGYVYLLASAAILGLLALIIFAMKKWPPLACLKVAVVFSIMAYAAGIDYFERRDR
jgi:uncharacterized membrane protein YqjE